MNREVCEHFNPVDLPCAKCAEKRKSEAMFLADELESPLGTIRGAELHRRAAAELRRLHAENERLHAQRDALLEALRRLLCTASLQTPITLEERAAARAAIKAVEGDKT